MKLKQLSAKIQVKFHPFSQKYTQGFARPLQKLIRRMPLGMLKSSRSILRKKSLMNALLWTAVSFLYIRLDSLRLEIICV